MSNPIMAAPAGWYADPNGAPSLRWWDGQNWTEYQSGGAPGARRDLPAHVSTSTVWIWLIVLLPILNLGSLFTIDLRGMMVRAMADPANPLAVYGVGYFAALAFSWIVCGLIVWFSYLDWKALKQKGVDRPFHWAWAFFIGYPVYLIGRTVIVYKVSKQGLGPIWAYIGVFVLGLIVTIAWFAWMMQSVFDYVSPYSGYYS